MDSGDHITVEMRLAAIEEKLDRLLAHLGLDENPGFGAGGALPAAAPMATPAVGYMPNAMMSAEQEVLAYVQAGKKIQAIKAYRQMTGVGLKEAKDAVDAMERNMRGGGRR